MLKIFIESLANFVYKTSVALENTGVGFAEDDLSQGIINNNGYAVSLYGLDGSPTDLIE
jgi:hypothetical protein